MMHKVTREELARIDTMTALEAVAYANRVSNRLKCGDCAHEERQNGLALLERLTERVSFLKITLETPTFCRIGWSQKNSPAPEVDTCQRSVITGKGAASPGDRVFY